jgi:hypothetical protein
VEAPLLSRWDSQNPLCSGWRGLALGYAPRVEWYDGDTKTFKKLVRVVSKVVGCAAGAVFFIAPVTSFNGFVWMAGSAYMGGELCVANS